MPFGPRCKRIRLPVRRRFPRHPILLLALAVVAATPALAQKSGQPSDKPPPAVVVAAVETTTVDKSSRFIDNVQAIQSVDLKARVEGSLEDVAFRQGSMVDEGQVLYRIEQDQYKADLAQAQGQLAAADAESQAADADLEDKAADFERQSTLIETGDNAEINLGYTTIKSPIAGRIGATAVTEGNGAAPLPRRCSGG